MNMRKRASRKYTRLTLDNIERAADAREAEAKKAREGKSTATDAEFTPVLGDREFPSFRLYNFYNNVWWFSFGSSVTPYSGFHPSAFDALLAAYRLVLELGGEE